MESTLISFEHPDCVLRVPGASTWEFDAGGAEQGLFILKMPGPGQEQFHANAVIVQRPDQHAAHPAGGRSAEDYLEEQRRIDEQLANDLTDYRTLQLDWDQLGEDGTPAVLRVASYTFETGVPVTLFQWSGCRDGLEVSFGVTFPTDHLQHWLEPAFALGRSVQWRSR